jgi:hypothetical protein
MPGTSRARSAIWRALSKSFPRARWRTLISPTRISG